MANNKGFLLTIKQARDGDRKEEGYKSPYFKPFFDSQKVPAIKLQSIFSERRGGAAFFLSRFFRKKIRRKCRHHLRGKNVVFLFSEVSIQVPDPAVKDLAELVTEIINDL